MQLVPGHAARQRLPGLDAGVNALVTRSYGVSVFGQDLAHTALIKSQMRTREGARRLSLSSMKGRQRRRHDTP